MTTITTSISTDLLTTIAQDCTFKSLLINKGQDPSVVYEGGYYYLVQSEGGHLTIRKSVTLAGLSSTCSQVIFTPPSGTAYSADMWAPDLVYLRGNWYIYFTANDVPGNNAMHRMFVLQADTDDPCGTWSFKGNVYQDRATDKWAIDGVAFEYNDKLYMIWSGWHGDKGDFPQNLYIAEMTDPTTISGQRVMISQPDQAWERSVAPIQEAPTPFIYSGQLSIVYSADASWSTSYKLGLLKLNGTDPLNPDAWTKVGAVFEQSPEAGIYGPGHNSLPVCSPDGTQHWLVYHAKAKTRKGWGDRRIHVQPFTWNADHTPHFGTPLPANSVLPFTANDVNDVVGNNGGVMVEPIVVEYNDAPQDNDEMLDAGDMLLSELLGSYSISAWVKLDRAEGLFTISGQQGKIGSAFTLYYDNSADKFGFSMNNWRGDSIAHTLSKFSPREGEWYHVVGVCDMLRDEIALYVNGVLESTAACNCNWDVNSQTILDAEQNAALHTALLAGALNNVQFYNNALAHHEITALFSDYVIRAS